MGRAGRDVAIAVSTHTARACSPLHQKQREEAERYRRARK